MSDVARSVKEGLGFGLIAGAVLAVAQVIAAAAIGEPAIFVFRRFASVLLGSNALELTAPATAVAIGVIAHLYLSAVFGLFYGIYNSALTLRTRRSVGRQAVVGPLYGAMLWLVDFQVFARVRYPWFLAESQLLAAILHIACFGLPLGLLYATAERRVGPVRVPFGRRRVPPR